MSPVSCWSALTFYNTDSLQTQVDLSRTLKTSPTFGMSRPKRIQTHHHHLRAPHRKNLTTTSAWQKIKQISAKPLEQFLHSKSGIERVKVSWMETSGYGISRITRCRTLSYYWTGLHQFGRCFSRAYLGQVLRCWMDKRSYKFGRR